MSPIVFLVMFGWLPAVLYLFSRFPPQKAVVISFVFAWLFLPMAEIVLPAIPNYTKMSATCYGVLLATFIFDSGRFSMFQPRWIDIPMTLWCIAPLIASISNDLGLYDGVSALLTQSVSWGLPYFLGRLYLGNLSGAKHLAIAVFIGGLAYMPLCLLETRISPQLHRLVYGYHAFADFSQTMRYGGYRPTVFMQHGLAVGVWMMAATLVGIWLWYTGVIKKVAGYKLKVLVPALFITFFLCKSTGAYILLLVGVLILFTAKYLRTSFLLLIIIAFICFYLNLGISGVITPEVREGIRTQLTQFLDEERVASLDFRLANEEILSEKAKERMLFGWGGWGRARVYNDEGEDISVTDSLWIIAYGNYGVFGLINLTASMLIPTALFAFMAYPVRLWAHPQVASAAVLVVIVTLFMLDCVLNAMTNPVFTLASGSISGLVINPTPLKRRQPKPRRLHARTEDPVKAAQIAISK